MFSKHRYRAFSIRPRSARGSSWSSPPPKSARTRKATPASSHLGRFLALGPAMCEAWPGSCGPGCLGRIFPDGPFSLVCTFHDFAYMLGGTREDFNAVEKVFRRWLIDEALAARRFVALWLFMAFTYSAFTRVWGWHLRRWRRADRPLTPREMRATSEFKDAANKVRQSR